mmetsp:Transcript_38125/g.89862  ORF Transcript_38125/g.89862 Transcript_38125/m.89862 type:complete len:203 (+) Transcript_38125:380-988(+)
MPPAYASNASVTHIPHAIGPRAAISAIIASSPLSWPCAATLQRGYSLTSEQTLGMRKLLNSQFSHVPIGLHSPSLAVYCWHVMSGTSLASIHVYAAVGSPPWQPAVSFAFTQLISTWAARLTSGKDLLRRMLILSLTALVVAWAQQLPQYMGICWFLSIVAKLRPPMLRTSYATGRSLSRGSSDAGVSRTLNPGARLAQGSW